MQSRVILILVSFFVVFIFVLFGYSREINFIIFSMIVFILGIISIRYLFLFFILLLPIPLSATIGPVNINLIDIICLVFFIYILTDMKHSYFGRNKTFFHILIIYYIFTLIYFFNGPFVFSNIITHIVRYTIEPLIILFTALRMIRNKKDITIITFLLLFSTSIAVILELYQFSFIFNLPKWEKHYIDMVDFGFFPKIDWRFEKMKEISYRRPGGFFQYGSELATFIPIVVYLTLNYLDAFSIKKAVRFSLNILLVLLVVGLLLTGGRGMVIAFALSFITYYFLKKRGKLKLIVFSGILLSLLVSYYIPEYLIKSYTLRERIESGYSRLTLSKLAINDILEFPTFIIGTTNPKRAHSHNKFIDEFHTKGIFGFLIYIVFQFKLIKFSLNKRRRKLLIPLVVFWLVTSLTTASPFGTIHTQFLFPLIVVISNKV